MGITVCMAVFGVANFFAEWKLQRDLKNPNFKCFPSFGRKCPEVPGSRPPRAPSNKPMKRTTSPQGLQE